jgi:hypothetical protein
MPSTLTLPYKQTIGVFTKNFQSYRINKVYSLFTYLGNHIT